jgi:hypothetical protein
MLFVTHLIDFFALVGNTLEGLAGWRYLFSARYRRRLHDRLRALPRAKARLEVASLALSFAFTLVGLAIVAIFAMLIFRAHSG